MNYYFNYKQCEDAVREIMQKVPVLRARQLGKIIYQISDGVTVYESALIALRKIQRRGYIFLSSDGWVLSRGAAGLVAGDDNLTELDTMSEFALGDITPDLVRLGMVSSTIDCFWPCIEFYPGSKEFIANLTPPWSICFETSRSGNNKLYEIMKVPKGQEYTSAEILKQLPPVDEQARKDVIRVAFIEDEKAMDILPRCGIKYFCVADEMLGRGFRIIGKREDEERW